MVTKHFLCTVSIKLFQKNSKCLLSKMFLEWWSTTKSLSNIWQYFSCLLDEGIAEICMKFYSHVVFWGGACRPRQDTRFLPGGLDYLSYLAGSSNSHHEISISSCIFLHSPQHVDMKKIAKCWNNFLRYSHTLKVAFFQKVWFVFQISKSQKKNNIPNHYPELEIWNFRR